MAFYKILSALVIALSVFSSNVYSMNGESDEIFSEEVHHSLISVAIKEDIDKTTPVIKKEKSCSHWGLSHWLSGIGEYLQTCLCTKVEKEEGLYRHTFENKTFDWGTNKTRSSPPTVVISDCYFNYFNDTMSDPRLCHLAWCCCPCSTITHLCCLPCACCKVSKTAPEEILHRKDLPSYYMPLQTSEEKGASDAFLRKKIMSDLHRGHDPKNCPGGGNCPH